MVSNPVKDWVDSENIFRMARLFNTSPDPTYPIFKTVPIGQDCKRFVITFSPENSCYQDAGFAIRMMKKFIEYNQSKTHYCTVSFSHQYKLIRRKEFEENRHYRANNA